MGITRERVRQIEAQALGRLRNPGLRKELFDFVST
jgi:DNA-directed RNA polymerase sigma subunit (sigma70/sigma32)